MCEEEVACQSEEVKVFYDFKYNLVFGFSCVIVYTLVLVLVVFLLF